MPKVTWCKTEAMRQAEAGEEFFRRLEAARRYENISVEMLIEKCGMNRMTYYNRKKDPEKLTAKEIRKLAAAVKLTSTQEGRDALLRLVGAI